MMLRTFKQFFLSAVLAAFSLNLVHAQNQSGFISIDSGLTENSSYNEDTTGIHFISDANFIDTGESKSVSYDNRNKKLQQYWSLRSFPQGIRNCYKINVTSGTRYLIRATFYDGNYDGENKLPEFELHLGPNLWDSVKPVDGSIDVVKEVIHVCTRSYIHVCLVNTDSGVPFISTIELRPLPSNTYQTQQNQSMALVTRYDTGLMVNRNPYRYPEDIHDRRWHYYNYNQDDWTQLNTTYVIDNYHRYQPPSVVMTTAATPKNPTDSLVITIRAPEGADSDARYYSYLHFAELENLQPTQSRLLYVSRDGKRIYGPFAPDYLSITTVFSTEPWNFTGQYVEITITEADSSTLPPILNAIEIYIAKKFLESETNQQDVDAITNIKSSYIIGKNWQGDPCAPEKYSWEGVKCSYPENEPPVIISLNLSSYGLTGEVASSISSLSMIQTLDLSNNNLTGLIPDFLSQFPNLTILNLEKNNLKGTVPVGLIERWKNGMLSLSLCGNPNLSGPISCKSTKKKNNFVIPLVVSIVGMFVLLPVVAICWCRFQRKRQFGVITDAKATIQLGSLESTKRKFTHSEILKITNNFERVLGKGGFGTVYHGYIDKIQVAIKILSPSSVQGLQQFNAEVDILMRVHHKNLTNLVGYCNDETKLGLVYEYMANGNLQEHLSDGRSYTLTWEDRLRIATDAAQELEYLHYGCKPPIMHRDVKSTNILLNESFQAKLSDFGLSRNFPTNDGTRATSILAGTPGYLDPEFFLSNRSLDEKSDVYSFGIVPKSQDKMLSIRQWVGFMLANGDIYNIVDPSLEGDFNVNSVWKAVEIAMACASTSAIKRPLMTQVVADLKECLATELARTEDSHESEYRNSIEMMPENSIANLIPSVR